MGKQDKGSGDESLLVVIWSRGWPLGRKSFTMMSEQGRASPPASYRQVIVLASPVLTPSGQATSSGIFPCGLGLDAPDFLTTRHSNRGVSWCHFQVGGNWWSLHRSASSCRSLRNRWPFLVMTSHEEAQSL